MLPENKSATTTHQIKALKVCLLRCVKNTPAYCPGKKHWFYQPVSVGIRLTSQWGILANVFSMRKNTPRFFLHIAVNRPLWFHRTCCYQSALPGKCWSVCLYQFPLPGKGRSVCLYRPALLGNVDLYAFTDQLFLNVPICICYGIMTKLRNCAQYALIPRIRTALDPSPSARACQRISTIQFHYVN